MRMLAAVWYVVLDRVTCVDTETHKHCMLGGGRIAFVMNNGSVCSTG